MLLAMVVSTVAIGTSYAHPSILNFSLFILNSSDPAPKDTTTQKKPRYSVRKTSANNQKEAEPKAIDLKERRVIEIPYLRAIFPRQSPRRTL